MVSKKINIINLNNQEKGYLTGLFIGDGYLYYDKCRHYQISFYLNEKKDRDVARFAIILLRKIGLLPYVTSHHGCLIIRINSKVFYKYLKMRSGRLSQIKNRDFMIGFISGFIDSDGYVGKGDIVISNVEKDILKITQSFCEHIGINSKIWSQKTLCKGNICTIQRLRIGTKFKYKNRYSRKIHRIYGGDIKLPNHSEQPSQKVVPIRVG